MAERPEFSPQQLDQLEDALERLDHEQLPEDELSSEVRERLEEYREVLATTRQALPDEDAPAEVIDRVLQVAESGDAGAVDDSVQGVVDAQRRPRWSRLWKAVVPALALAGGAAVVLWWIRPEVGTMMENTEMVEPQATPATAVSPAEQPETPAEPAGAATKAPAPAFEAASDGSQAHGEEAERAGREPRPDDAKQAESRESVAQAPAEDRGAGSRARRRSDRAKRPTARPRRTQPAPEAGARRSRGSVADESGAGPRPAAPKPQARPGPETTMTAVRAAHDKRRAGRCGLARLTYQKAIASETPTLVAHGHAGLGLCELAAGREGSAHFTRARKADPGIAEFIRRERARLRSRSPSPPAADAEAEPERP